MKARLKKILPFVGYGAFYLLVFVLSVYWTFPYETLRDRVVAEFAKSQGNSSQSTKLTIDRLEPYWFSGVHIQGAQIIIPGEPTLTGPPPAPTVLEIEEGTARLSMWSKLFGTTNVNFSGKVLGGEIEGSFTDKPTERHIKVEIKDVLVGQIKKLSDTLNAPLFGSIRGSIDLTFPEKKMSLMEGKIDLDISDFAIGDGKAKLMDKLAMPKISLGEFAFHAEAEKGTLKINKFGATGKDLDVIGDGKIGFRDRFQESRTEMFLRFKFSQKYTQKSDITKGLFALMDLDPKVRSAKRPDGFYGWKLTGLVTNPRTDPYSGNEKNLRSPIGGSKGRIGPPLLPRRPGGMR
jgi:type II secretion system protein N